MKFGFDWSGGFSGEDFLKLWMTPDGRRSMAILKAHLQCTRLVNNFSNAYERKR